MSQTFIRLTDKKDLGTPMRKGKDEGVKMKRALPEISLPDRIKDLAVWSRESHGIMGCILAVPAVMGMAWISFPFLEAWNLGYPLWHGACLVAGLMVGGGITCWMAQKWEGGRSTSWIPLLILTGLGLAVIQLFFAGDFYWAFDRGYFLH